MRFILALLWMAPILAFGQQSAGVWDSLFRYAADSADVASGKSVFDVAKPDILVQVKKHPFGADLFEITAVMPNYPADLLNRQVNKMCELIGVPARGLLVGSAGIGGDPKLTSTRATFATDGVINREKGTLRIEPIIQAFAGAPSPYTVHGITILFNGEQPTDRVLRNFRGPGLRLQATALENPPVIEYRIQLLSQDPNQLKIPSTEPVEQNRPQTASTVQQNGVDWSLWIPLFTAAVAAGILVYFLMVRASTKPRR